MGKNRGIREEFAGADLGDERRLERLMGVAELMARSPGSSYAGMCRTEAEREGLYRFIRSDHFSPDAVLEPHVVESASRAQQARCVLAIHDTTKIQLCAEAELESYLSGNKKGFLAHVSFLVDGGTERRPLGIAAIETIERAKGKARTKKNGRRKRGDETAKLENKEYDRWARGVAKTEELLDVDELIHVIDAEGDSYALLAYMHDQGNQFVVRLCHDRCAKGVGHDEEWSHVRELLDNAKSFKLTRDVHVSKRRARRAPQAAKAHPARDARTAQLTFSFATVVVKRPWYVKSGSADLRLNVVRAYEKSPPAGVQPIDWILLTNQPVVSKSDAMRIVDIYRQRWLIEEFFRTLKTGCAFRKRKLTNRHSIYNSLSILAPIAWRALLLRQAARIATMPASQVLSSIELQVMRATAASLSLRLSKNPNANEALLFLAQLGGHRRSNGPPGCEILMRGLQKLGDLVTGWTLCQAIPM